MSEEKTNPNVEKMLTHIDKLTEKVERLEKTLSNNNAESPKGVTPHEETHHGTHWKAEEILKTSDDCPQCKAEKEKLRQEFGKPYLEEHWREKLPYICEGCGEGVFVDEEACPKCHGKKAKKRA